MQDWIWPVLASPFLGSFAATLAERLPEGRPVLLARSSCGTCGRTLGPAELVPIFSFLLQRGRCRGCGARIDPALPAAEMIALALSLWAAAIVSGWLLWASVALGAVLLALSLMDLRTFTLSDALTLPLIPAGIAVAALVDPDLVIHHSLGALAGFSAFWALAALYQRFRGQEGLGLGDAKLLAAAGAWTGWAGLGSVVLLASLAALAIAAILSLRSEALGRQTPLPFGPFLAFGFWVTWLHGPLVLL